MKNKLNKMELMNNTKPIKKRLSKHERHARWILNKPKIEEKELTKVQNNYNKLILKLEKKIEIYTKNTTKFKNYYNEYQNIINNDKKLEDYLLEHKPYTLLLANIRNCPIYLKKYKLWKTQLQKDFTKVLNNKKLHHFFRIKKLNGLLQKYNLNIFNLDESYFYGHGFSKKIKNLRKQLIPILTKLHKI